MTAPDTDALWMQRALELARRGLALCSPNPIVGCVLLDAAGQLAGEGWHAYDQLAHAEIAALRDARQKSISVRGGTAYVTLEPCSHTGRTPPCTQALIAAGLARVVAATIDPNPAVAGRGLAVLRAAGIETTVGVCQPEARRLNEPFARWIQHRRPLVLMKVAMTLDGRIAPPLGEHPVREPFWITSEAARLAVHHRGDGRGHLGRVRRERRHQAEQGLGQAQALPDPLQPGDQQPAHRQADNRPGHEGRRRDRHGHRCRPS